MQVKSATSQAEFDAYRSEFTQSEYQRMFYAYHTGDVTSAGNGVTVLGPQKLGEMVLDAGLVSWLMKKVG